MFRCLIGGCGKTCISLATTASLQPDDLLAVFQNFCFNGSGGFVPGDCAQRDINKNILSKPPAGIITAAGFTIFSENIFIISERKKGPGIFISTKNDMTSSSAVATIRSREGIILRSHEMFTSSSAMATLTKNTDLVYKIAFFHFVLLGLQR